MFFLQSRNDSRVVLMHGLNKIWMSSEARVAACLGKCLWIGDVTIHGRQRKEIAACLTHAQCLHANILTNKHQNYRRMLILLLIAHTSHKTILLII